MQYHSDYSYYDTLHLQDILGRTLIFDPVPWSDTVPTIQLPGYVGNTGDTPPIGAEYRIINNTYRDLPFDLYWYNTFYVPSGMYYVVPVGGFVRIILVNVASNGYYEWAVVGNLEAVVPQ